MNTDLTKVQLNGTDKPDYALFLPATSGFYSTFIGKQRYGNYVDPARIPAGLTNGVESLNYLNPDKGAFYYKWCLYSAGHANRDLNKFDESEDMFRNRDRSTSFTLADSAGYQLGKNIKDFHGDWTDVNCPRSSKHRKEILAWMDALMDYGMCLDIPAWAARNPDSKKNIGIGSYQDAVNATYINNDYFVNNRNGNCKFLNVLQGENHADAEDWYQRMKHYCDPKQFGDRAFNGWAFGGQNMCDVHLVLKRLVALRFDNLLEIGQHDWAHFLGTSKLEWATLLTDIQRSVRKYHNPNFTISFDCASPFLATANGQIYTQTEIADRTKWVYRMVPSADNKKYATDSRLFKDAVIQDGIFSNFESSPIIDQCKISDICINKPGDLNKIGKEGKTSWDSFSYALQMGHNVYRHIDAVQRANQSYDSGIIPSMLVQEKFDRTYFREVVDAIFSTSDRASAEAVIDDFDRFWQSIIGTRGATGKKTVNATTYYSVFFEEVASDTPAEPHGEEFTDEETAVLDSLEENIKQD